MQRAAARSSVVTSAKVGESLEEFLQQARGARAGAAAAAGACAARRRMRSAPYSPRLTHLCSRAQATKDPKRRLLMSSMAECVRTIAYKVRDPPLRARAATPPIHFRV